MTVLTLWELRKGFCQVERAPRKRGMFAALPPVPTLLHPGKARICAAQGGALSAGRHVYCTSSVSKA